MGALIGLWFLFFVSHSVLAATSVKSFFEKTGNFSPPQYRLIYTVVATVLLSLIVFELWKIPSPMLYAYNSVFFGMGCGLTIISLWLLKQAFKEINLSAFLGFSAATESTGLITTGLYSVVRHPLYFGSAVLLLGIFLIFPTQNIAVSVLFSLVYIVIGIEFEEKKLRQTFGSAYDDFARGKKKFLPFIY